MSWEGGQKIKRKTGFAQDPKKNLQKKLFLKISLNFKLKRKHEFKVFANGLGKTINQKVVEQKKI
jgi:hypothetical protein